MTTLTQTIAITVLRLTAGLGMSTHGYSKIFGGMEAFTAGVAKLGFPQPEVFAWVAALSELVGGICLALGAGTRLSAFLVGGVMVVAVFIRHAADPFQRKELGIIYLAIMVFFLLSGGGRWSVDSILKKKAAAG